ncbi:2-oxoacid:acceptor oxidoreductase subunit alpha [Aureispira]|nr:2-oxoacid:acceptor oxidoreductase subunit alpha [Aureispira sp.]
MKINAVNDFVIRFANVNGSGSASANNMFAKAIFRMGIPVSPKNIFPSNIQGLPTWFEVRVNEKGYLGRRAGVDIMVSLNPQSMVKDIESVNPGGYFIYDSTKKLYNQYIRPDINYVGIPMMQLAMDNFKVARLQQLFKNVIYVGALCALLDIDVDVIKGIIAEQFEKKQKLIPSNYLALDLGINYVKENIEYPLGITVRTCDNIGDKIMVEGNDACALGAVYGGATVIGWYPITPSTSIAGGFESFCKKLRVDQESGKNKFAVIQAEDELAAMGMVIGASWNGARAFTTTSGPGVSLMSEFIGLAYFAEIPVVLINVQRGGPSTGMPTRTQQPDILSTAYCSHGDTKHPMIFPSTPTECFEMTAECLDLANVLQTPVFLMSDLDLGMNYHITDPFKWDDSREYNKGKILSAEDLDKLEKWGRYLDVDKDGVCYRTIPGTHPTKGSFFTRGTSRDEYAQYTEDGSVYVRVVDRILKKWETAKGIVPVPELYQEKYSSKFGLIFFGTTTYSALEAMDIMEAKGMELDSMRVRSFPFNETVEDFIAKHEYVFVIEQNRDAQFRSLFINELGTNPTKLIPILNYDGMPITAATIVNLIQETNILPVKAEQA